MEIKIYQIMLSFDQDNFAFQDLEMLEKRTGAKVPDSSLYNEVFVGAVDCKNLEEVYEMLNISHPDNYRGRSLSVSDVVEVVDGGDVEPGFYFCDSIGFAPVDFNASKTRHMIRTVMLEPGKLARATWIDRSLKGLQETLGGYIEAIYPFEERVCIICNEEGKINGMELNRALYDEDGDIADIIAGPCLICDCSGDDFGSLSVEQTMRYKELFKFPQAFVKLDDSIMAIPYNPRAEDLQR